MADRPSEVIREQAAQFAAACAQGWQVIRHRGPSQVQFWFIALLVGVAAGVAALFFRKGINALQNFAYQNDDVRALASHAESLPWYWVLVVPVIGGLVVGLILHRFTEDGRVHGVADVIEGAALDEGRVKVETATSSSL